MKTAIFTAIENAKNVLNNVKAARQEANREYTSLSHVLKEMKTKTLWGLGYGQAFAAVGINSPEELTPKTLRGSLAEECTLYNEKTEQEELGIWGEKKLKDENGDIITDANGNPVTEPVFRVVKSWTPNKVLTILAQSQAFWAQEDEEEEA